METCVSLETSSSLMLSRVKLLKSFGKILYIHDGYKVSSLFLVFGVLCPKVACSSTGCWTGSGSQRGEPQPAAPALALLPPSHLPGCL